jgi:hypothetical protein
MRFCFSFVNNKFRKPQKPVKTQQPSNGNRDVEIGVFTAVSTRENRAVRTTSKNLESRVTSKR